MMANIFGRHQPRQGFNCRMISTWLVLEMMSTVVCATTVLLNSCENCVSQREYEVKSEFGYLVKVGPIEESCQWECTVRIHSSTNSSWLCLAQDGLMSQINDSNAQLFVSDAVGSPFVHLKYYPDKWQVRETCRKTHFMDFSLRKVNSRAGLDIGKLRVQLKVLDIESKNRSAFFDISYCSTVYSLLNSQVSFFNIPSEVDRVTYTQHLASSCGITIQMEEVDRTSSNKICFWYIPTNFINCNSNWTLYMSVDGYHLNAARMAYTLHCWDEKATKMHTWCADSGLNRVVFILKRNRSVARSTEHPKMFQIVVSDYNGTAESLFNEKTSRITEMINQPEDEKSSNMTWITVIVVMIVSVMTSVIVITLVYRRRRKMPCVRHSPVYSKNTRSHSLVSPSEPQSV